MLLHRGVSVGRDQLFALLRRENILQKRRRNFKRTTNSNHWFKKYPNIIKDLEVVRPNQVFVSDITYIATREGYCYLSLITDLYSRKIVGWELSRNLTAAGPQKAVNQALSGVAQPEKLIHHSDRGIQFCSRGYVNRLQHRGVRISMTEENHVYENAVAERINGILKKEFALNRILPSFNIACSAINEAVKIYNNERLHLSLGYRTPAETYAA
jgi:putative transposase